jgi:HSP20 family protein
VSLFTVFSRLHPAVTLAPLASREDGGCLAPPVDVHETAGEVVVEIDLPGTSLAHVRVTGQPDALHVEGLRSPDPPGGAGRFLRVERSAGRFDRVVPLPSRVAVERASARFRDGVLTVRLPKLPAADR